MRRIKQNYTAKENGFSRPSGQSRAGFAKDAARVAPSLWGEGRDEGGHETI